MLSDADPSVLICSKNWPGARIRIASFCKLLGGVLRFLVVLSVKFPARLGSLGMPSKGIVARFSVMHMCRWSRVVMFKTPMLTVLFHANGMVYPACPRSQLQRVYLNTGRALLGRHYKGDMLHVGEDSGFVETPRCRKSGCVISAFRTCAPLHR